jgi:AcrR family transcriptional regulator
MTGGVSEVGDSGVTERAARTQDDILEVATAEFAANGYAGARVDEIAARTRTTKRMIYYYFGSKEGLYLAVLERVYAQIRRVERGIHIDRLSPADGLRTIAEATYDHHTTHEAFIQLVSIENIHRAEHVRQSQTILHENATAITLLQDVIERGVADGAFRDDVDAVDVHMIISAYACFHVANRHTFAAIFGRDMLDPSLQDSHRRLIGDLVVATMTSDAVPATPLAERTRTPGQPGRTER